MEEKLGFFGGCFNPITNAHLELIKQVIKKENLSKVYFVPMGNFYQKTDLISLENRIEMLKIAFQNEEKIDILNISNNEKKMYAIDTFKLIDEKFPEVQRFFIMGSDNYKKIATWKNSEELLKNYNYIILDREKKNTKDISSSIVREKLRLGECVDNLLPKAIAEYIKQNNLYR